VAEWFDFDFAPVISTRVKTIRYTLGGEDPAEAVVPNDNVLWMVRRDAFDYFLVQQGQRQGVTLWDGTKAQAVQYESDRWQVQTSHEAVFGRYLIAADGARGTLAKWLGFTQRRFLLAAALEMEPRLPMPDEPVVHFDLGILPQGYVWNFPKADGYSIGGGVLRVGQQRQQDLRAPMTTYAASFGVETTQLNYYGHPIYLWDGFQSLHTERALLAGEAACVVDPFTSEGIRPSMWSGLQAAVAIDRAIAGDVNALSNYTTVINQEWGTEMRWARRLAQLVYRAPKIAYQLGVRRPSSTATMAQLFCGQLQYSEVASRAIQRLSGGWLKTR
jgi:flavin-dependent dehydrogenase